MTILFPKYIQIARTLFTLQMSILQGEPLVSTQIQCPILNCKLLYTLTTNKTSKLGRQKLTLVRQLDMTVNKL